MNNLWRTLLVLGALLTLTGGLFALSREDSRGQPALSVVQIDLPDAPGMRLEIADEAGEREAGLSDRPPLRDSEGMVFVFEKEGIYPFWMKDMRFPLDILYLRDGVVTEVFFGIPPPASGQEPVTVRPQKPANQVLEVRAGFAEERAWPPETRLFPPDFLR